MDILEHLIQEHRSAEQLLRRLAKEQKGFQRDELVGELVEALHKHMELEERFLYPIVSDVMGDDRERAAEMEHELTRQGLDQLQELTTEGGFEAAVAMVTAGVKHHVEDEESGIFPQLRRHASDRLAQMDPEQLEQELQQPARGGATGEPTKEQLYEQAKRAGIEGRSTMTKQELAAALSEQ